MFLIKFRDELAVAIEQVRYRIHIVLDPATEPLASMSSAVCGFFQHLTDHSFLSSLTVLDPASWQVPFAGVVLTLGAAQEEDFALGTPHQHECRANHFVTGNSTGAELFGAGAPLTFGCALLGFTVFMLGALGAGGGRFIRLTAINELDGHQLSPKNPWAPPQEGRKPAMVPMGTSCLSSPAQRPKDDGHGALAARARGIAGFMG
jgi:hypothetical protein